MKSLKIVIAVLMPVFIFAQKGIDVTGRVSLRVQNVAYDEQSQLNPDSADYGKTTLIPGLQQRLNMALFARTSSLDITLLGDLKNDKWNELGSYDNVDRLTLSARFGKSEIVLGDFFDSGSELFLQSRQVRGGKIHLVFEELWNRQAFLETRMTGGIVQRALSEGEKLNGLYKQYESGGQYCRYFASAEANIGERNSYQFGLHYLYGKDDENSITESINEPLTNQNIGGHGSVFFWKQNFNLFAEAYFSRKDTLSATSVQDNAYKGGIDFRYKDFKLMAYYHRIGYDYFTAGYPFLLTDRQGFKVVGAWDLFQGFSLIWDGEQYNDNLDNRATDPTTTTRMAELGFTTQFKNMPDFTARFRFRDDLSNTIINENDEEEHTDRTTQTFDATLGYSFSANRLAFSALYINLDDHSLLPAGSQPLGTDQFILNLNFYTRPSTTLFISGGAVYSNLGLTDGSDNINLVIYESSRWDVIPRKLLFESTVNYISNKASGGDGYQDLLNNYNQLGIEVTLEFFFNSNISLKLVGGTDMRNMKFTNEEALKVIADPDYGPMYFNGYESYNGLIYGAEINWIF